jgi:hypothetical protein
MGKSTHLNRDVNHPKNHPGSIDPTVGMTRDQRGDIDDPYRVWAHHPQDTYCAQCDAVVHEGLWVIDPDRKHLLVSAGGGTEITCPACLRAQEQVPGGILTVSGSYWPEHRHEIFNLIRNEAHDAGGRNPMERILRVRSEGERLVVETSNEKLAQHLGRCLKKAHHGEVAYDWGDGNPLARVTWQRDL